MSEAREITADELRDLKRKLSYSKISGLFRWRYTTSNKSKKGSLAGGLATRGYIRINIGRRSYKAHRLAWAFVYGLYKMPKIIDHKDTKTSHNWISNLRDASQSQNLCNQKLSKRSKTKAKGVHYNKKARKYQAQVCLNGISSYLGLFSTKSEAIKAVKKERKILHGKFFNNGGK